MRTLANIAVVGAVVSASAALPARAEDHVIDQDHRTFSQTQITIHPGDAIVFKNSDVVAHNVFSVSPGMGFDIRRQAPGGSSTVPFPNEGVAEVRCAIHPQMKLMVTVKK